MVGVPPHHTTPAPFVPSRPVSGYPVLYPSPLYILARLFFSLLCSLCVLFITPFSCIYTGGPGSVTQPVPYLVFLLFSVLLEISCLFFCVCCRGGVWDRRCPVGGLLAVHASLVSPSPRWYGIMERRGGKGGKGDEVAARGARELVKGLVGWACQSKAELGAVEYCLVGPGSLAICIYPCLYCRYLTVSTPRKGESKYLPTTCIPTPSLDCLACVSDMTCLSPRQEYEG